MGIFIYIYMHTYIYIHVYEQLKKNMDLREVHGKGWRKEREGVK